MFTKISNLPSLEKSGPLLLAVNFTEAKDEEHCKVPLTSFQRKDAMFKSSTEYTSDISDESF